MLLRHANRLAPDDPYIRASLAEVELAVPGTDSIGLERAYDAIAERFRLEPTNQRYAAVFSNLAQQARRIDDIVDIRRMQDSLRPDRSDPAFNLAASLTARFGLNGDTADLDEALAIYSRLEKGLGHTLPVSGRKINIFLALKDTASVLSEISMLEHDAPRDIDTKLFAATLYDHLGMPDSALSRFERAAAIDPDNGSVYRPGQASLGNKATVFATIPRFSVLLNHLHSTLRLSFSCLPTMWPSSIGIVRSGRVSTACLW